MISRRTFLSWAGAAPAAWARLRQPPPFPDWPEDYLDQMLTDSPWARQFSARVGVGEFFPVLRWSSALPVRRALALVTYGRDGLGDPRVLALLARPEEYVLELGGIPTTLVKPGAAVLEAELLRTARIYRKDRRPLEPVDVRVPAHGMHLAATLRFPRWEDLAASVDGELIFACQAAGARLEQRFKLRAMVYQGNLEL